MKLSCRRLVLPHETSTSVTYIPDILCGEDSFTFKVNNGYLDSASATITITVGDLNPQALPQTVMVKKGIATGITLSSLDCSGPPNFTIVSQPFDGQLAGTDANQVYSPDTNPDFIGTDSFTFKVTGCLETESSPATVTLLVVPGLDTLAAECGPGSIKLTWDIDDITALFPNVEVVHGFNVYRSTTSSGLYGSPLNSTPLPKDQFSFTDTGVSAGTTFFYVVTFIHNEPSEESPTVTYESPISNEVSASICCPSSTSGFWVDQNVNATNMAKWIMGSGFTVSEARFTGAERAKGIFGNGSDADLPIETGVILSTGDIAFSKGPNNIDGGTSGPIDKDGDLDLEGLVSGLLTLDAAVLEFDIVSSIATTFVFEYFFASEEYDRWIGEFNDIVGIFVAPANGTKKNVAIVPATLDEPVAVNTIHNGNFNGTILPKNSDFFRENEPSSSDPLNIQFDGLTIGGPNGILPTEEVEILANVTYHIKIVIADAAGPNGTDRVLDSAVFIRAVIPCP